jgi:hypothetical protein
LRAEARALLPLALVSAASLGFEIALTRYFAVAKWSEYGYWVISIVLAGFALSGVVTALAQEWLLRRGAALLAALPAALIVAAAAGYHAVTVNPFNPLQLQNAATFAQQLWFIAGYYAALLPFFFLAGLFVALCFVRNPAQPGLVYGADLGGAGLGAASVLALMWGVPPFALPACLLIPLALAAAPRRTALLAAFAALLAGEALLLLDDRAGFNDFKAIYAPLHVPGSRVVARVLSPGGFYLLLDDFTERVDTDLSTDAGMLGLPGPPTTFGLYRDGNRIAALPKPPRADAPYAPATLAALPYVLIPHPRVLLIGASGGFRLAEARVLGAGAATVLEPEPVLRRAVRRGLGPAPPGDPRVLATSPLAAVRGGGGPYDVIDIAADFLDAAEANASAFTMEALAADLRALTPGGVVSVPVSIRDFPAYALRLLATARAALLAAGIDNPARHVLAYRSAWNLRLLLSPAPFDAARIAAARAFCDARSFDLSYYPGIDPAAARAAIYNDLPPVSFDTGEVASGGPAQDAIAEEAAAVLAGRPTPSAAAFNLAPITLDRPFWYALLRLDRVGTLLRRLELLPQAEVGALVNLAVLAQAAVIAAFVLLVPLAGGRRLRAPGGTVRAAAYFAALGLGYLAIEIALIERASFLLDDRTGGFALVLTCMLIGSGLGSLLSQRATARPARAAAVAAGIAVLWCAAMAAWLQPLLLAAVGLPFAARAAIVVGLAGPVAVALGLPFPLGLAETGGGPFLPWAWALNGAFSVVATPLANLVAREGGYSRVLLLALLLYAVAMATVPNGRKTPSWQTRPPS